MRLTRLLAAMLAAGLLLPAAAHAQTMTIQNNSSVKVHVFFFAASDFFHVVPCGQVSTPPNSMLYVDREASPHCKGYEMLSVVVNHWESWAAAHGDCILSPVSWSGVVVVVDGGDRYHCNK